MIFVKKNLGKTLFFFEKVSTYVITSNDNYLSSNQDTNQFLV